MSTTHVEASISGGGGDRDELAVPADGIRTFVLVSCGQFVAVTALTLVNFAAAFYVYETYSLTIIGLIYALPFVILLISSPFTGSLVDRWGARRALLVSNVGGLLLVATLAVLPLTGGLAMWHGVLIVLSVPLLKALLLPAFETSVPFLVPKRHLGRANGMRMFINGFGAVLGPFAAVLLLDPIGVAGIGLLVGLSLGLAVLALLPVRIPRARRDDGTGAGARALLVDFRDAWRYVRARHGLPALLAFFGATAFGLGFVEVLLPLLVLAFASESALVTVLGVGLFGMAVAGVAMTVWGGPRRRVGGLLGFSLLFAAAMVIGALRPSIALIAVAAFLFLGSTSIIVGTVQTILHTKVEPGLLGRVMGLKNVFYSATLMLGNILAGVIAGVVVPLVGEEDVRSGAVAAVVGDGPGRGFAVLLIVMGAVVALSVTLAHRYQRLRHLEEALPDVTPEDLAREPVRS
jgi:MFS transporter, DHA3 family, macrolide efflux protein